MQVLAFTNGATDTCTATIEHGKSLLSPCTPCDTQIILLASNKHMIVGCILQPLHFTNHLVRARAQVLMLKSSARVNLPAGTSFSLSSWVGACKEIASLTFGSSWHHAEAGDKSQGGLAIKLRALSHARVI